MAEEVIEIHRKRISEHRKNSGTSTEIANNINLVEKINENESERRSADGENNNEERVLTKTANSKVFLTKIFPRRPLSLPANRVSDVNHNLTNYFNESTTHNNANNEVRREKRKTFHQDVEEALNSLLWQPYEYQNKRTFSDSSSFSLSYTSCSSSLSSLDLEDYNNGSSVERVGNIAMDLHLAQEEMVNNLSLNRCDQLEDRPRSRDRRKASRLSGCSRTTGSECCAAVECSEEGACDDFGSKCDMRLEIPPSSNNNQDGNSNNCYQRSISTGNLSSANVVGLPPRQASMPPGNGIMFSNHPRNVSEPLQFRYNQTTIPPPASTFNHQRHNSHVDTTANMQQNVVQHMRSASVPKNMQPQKVGESNAKMINEGLQRALNVSNVNVNFYRAVPVNVVSSVPTIQCVNSTSNDTGNNVSNVHIMPLSGSSLPTHNNSTITTVPSMSFSTTVTGTTQVSVHNTQVPSYNVQVPTQTVQVQQSCSSTQVQTCTQPITAPPKRPTTTAPETRTRTFTSTEAQTDEISVCSPPTTNDNSARERRRERRRQQRRLTNNNNNNNSTNTTTSQTNDRLPDILNSHLPPPYSPPVPQPQVLPPPPPPGALVQPPQLVSNIVPSAIVGNAILPYPPPVVPGQVPLVQATAAPMPVPVTAAASGFRFPFPANGFRR